MENEKLDELIATAIQREEEAYDFYMGLLDRIRDEEVKNVITYIAEEEKKHRQFLVDYREGKFGAAPLRMSEVVFYQIAEHQKEPPLKADMSSADVFLVASHREQRSHAFYTELAELHAEDEAVRDMLVRIANEELKHKEKMEYLYANTAFPQTDGG
jgi:rubrerythrin